MDQNMDNYGDYAWQQNLLDLSAVDTAKRLSSDELLPYQYNPLDYNFEDLCILNDVEFGFMPSTLRSPSSPLESNRGSSISSSSFTCAEDSFDESEIDNNVLSRHFCNEPAVLLDFPDLDFCGDSQPQCSQTNTGHPTLSAEEIRRQYDIAMPALPQSPYSSDFTSSPEPEPESEIEVQTRKYSKQKQQSKANQVGPKRHIAHNIIEKRYRNNLNSKIAALRDCVPSLNTRTKENSSGMDSAESDLGKQNGLQRFNKATVLSKAVEYISQLEKRSESLSRKNTALQAKVTSLERHILTRREGVVGF